MNRIRKYKNRYQVLITPDLKIAPDTPILLGNWEDPDLRNYHVLEFDTLRDAQAEAFNHPDIDWYRLTLNHQHIFKRLEATVQTIIDDSGITVEFKSFLMDPLTMKNIMMDRVMNGGNKFNLRHAFNDIISLVIINPWTRNLERLSKLIEGYRGHLLRDDLRIISKQVIDGKIICLNGTTEQGTTYEIKLIPTALHHWANWFNKAGYLNEPHALTFYNQVIQSQDQLDKLPIT